MKINNQNKLSTILSLLDNHIVKELKKDEINEDKIDTLTTIRTEFIQELNSVKRGENISEMYDKKYWKTYRKSHY
jgi:hypothetical protein